MELTQQQIQNILDNAPDGATHVDYNRPNNITYMKGLNEFGYYYWYTQTGCESRQWRYHELLGHNEILDNFTPLSDLQKQLKPQEWDGEGLPPVGVECWFNWVNKSPERCKFTYIGDSIACYRGGDGVEFSVYLPQILSYGKIEIPEDKQARVREESAYELYCAWVGDFIGASPCTFNEFQEDKQHLKRRWLRVVDKSGYRKDDNNG